MVGRHPELAGQKLNEPPTCACAAMAGERNYVGASLPASLALSGARRCRSISPGRIRGGSGGQWGGVIICHLPQIGDAELQVARWLPRRRAGARPDAPGFRALNLRRLAQRPGGGHHLGERRNTSARYRVLRPQSGLAHRRSAGMRSAAFFIEVDHVLLRWDVGRVDVVRAGADFVGVVEVLEGVEQLHVRAQSRW